MTGWVTAVLLVVGSSLMLLAAVAVVRFPDLYARMQAATKASTLGMTCTMLAVAVHFASFTVGMRAIGVIVFFFLTAPVAAHMIGRAAYRVGVPLWEGTWLNEMPPPDRAPDAGAASGPLAGSSVRGASAPHRDGRDT